MVAVPRSPGQLFIARGGQKGLGSSSALRIILLGKNKEKKTETLSFIHSFIYLNKYMKL